MRLPGTLDDRLRVMRRERWELLRGTDTARLEDEGVRVDCALAGATACIQLRLDPDDVHFLVDGHCADFALLLDRGDDVFEAHIVELKRSVSEKSWSTIQGQHAWATVRLLAIAGVLDIRIGGVTVYTAFCNDKLSRERSPDPAAMKIPLDGGAEGNGRKRAEARRSWESGRIRMDVFQQTVEHRRIPTNDDGLARVGCLSRSSPGDGETTWIFEPVAPAPNR